LRFTSTHVHGQYLSHHQLQHPITMMSKVSYSMLSVATLLLLLSLKTLAYTTSHDLRQMSRNRKIWNIPTNSPPSQDLNMLKTSSSGKESRGSNWKLSQAAVNSMDTTFTTPRTARSSSSPLAHGLLSPEIVSRMDEITEGGHHNAAVRLFLQRYRRMGPMSCLEMLSDPEVLPHLTQAMRDLV
jgi:hypothetical protein